LAWVWDDNPSAGAGWFAFSLNGDYNLSADLTTFGKSVVEGPLRPARLASLRRVVTGCWLNQRWSGGGVMG